jgi:hypothetical protein
MDGWMDGQTDKDLYNLYNVEASAPVGLQKEIGHTLHEV